MIKAVIFDYFGVIATDSYWGDVKSFFNVNGNKNKIDNLTIKVNDGVISWYEFCKHIGSFIDVPAEEVDKKYHQLKLNKELILYIHSLKQKGIKIGLLSNASSEYLHSILDETGMNNIFDTVIVSSDIGVSKPHPGMYKAALQKLEVEPFESIFIDDLYPNIEAADNIGIHAIQYESITQAKGAINRLLADANDEFAG